MMFSNNNKDNDNVCEACNNDERNTPGHLNSATHRFNFLIWQFKTYKRALGKNRHGIEIHIQPKENKNSLDKIHLLKEYKENVGKHTITITTEQLKLHKNIVFSCRIRNNRQDKIFLTCLNLLHPSEFFDLIDHKEDNIYAIEPKANYLTKIIFSTKDFLPGSFKIPVNFSFQTMDDNTFTIIRTIVVKIISGKEENKMSKKSPFTKQIWRDIKHIIPATKENNYPCLYPIKKCYKRILYHGLQTFPHISVDEENFLHEIRGILKPTFRVTDRNYNNFWHILLWLEEIAAELMLRQYNMEKVTMSLKINVTLEITKVLELEVPGLSEKRPSILEGDIVEIRISEDHTLYKGIVQAVHNKTIDICHVDDELISEIEHDPTTLLDVAFVINRIGFERMHRAVDIVNSDLIYKLFPSPSTENLPELNERGQPSLNDSEFYNPKIAINEEQKKAVLKILQCPINYPYIVFGPPGTGKTITIVEAILQIKKRTNKRILVCAPANAACDMITTKLMIHCRKDELIRVHSQSREKLTLTPELLKYSNPIDEEGKFEKMTPNELMTYRIVVTTLILSGRYIDRNYNPDCLFIDEAAQATEPESAIPMGLLRGKKQIILAGDPKQLGPYVQSRLAIKYGLEISLLERLVDSQLYVSDKNNNFMTMLVLNFRSHPDILHIPNKLFYGGKLMAVSASAKMDPIVNCAIYPKIDEYLWKRKNQKIPQGKAIEFCGVSSKEEKEGASPSYFNSAEVSRVLVYVRTLVRIQQFSVTPDQIGIVTPYKRQVYKIRESLDREFFQEVEVGTTESFQGREKRIIIISCVRAQHNLLGYDRKYHLGFLNNEKRFNVALTRAISKLIIIGCPQILGKDEKWTAFMELCQSLPNTHFGVQYVPRNEEWKQKVIKKFEKFTAKDSQYSH